MLCRHLCLLSRGYRGEAKGFSCTISGSMVDGVLKGDSERPQDEYLITRAMRAGGEDSSVLLECMHAKNKQVSAVV